MGFKPFQAIRDRFAGLLRARAIKSRLFSGAPVLERIRLDRGADGTVLTLLYKNGLMLSLGDSGILDYQDRGFEGYMGEENPAARDREFLASLHRIVLQSLLRYITAPRLETAQRERAAEAASKLWLAWERRPEAPAVSADEPSWTLGSRREPASFH